MAREAKPPPGGWPNLSGVPTKIPELEGIFESMRPKRPPGTPKNGKDVWEKLKHDLEPPLSLYYTVLGNPDLLFSEATQAFDARLTAAASLLCRATLEAACYLFLTTKPATTRKGIKENFPLMLDGEVRKVQFDELIRAVKKAKILSPNLNKALSRIQENGNLIAHLGNIHAKQITKFEREARRFNKEIAHKKGITEDQRLREEMKVRRILRFWIDADEVLEDLIDTASILQTLAKHISLPVILRSSRESS
jgi:hypothetical protein